MYNDLKTTMDRIGKKLEVTCECREEEHSYEPDPYDEVARENMEAVLEANRLAENHD